VRSRAAASILARGGFQDAYSMEGGIRAWKGMRASGAPEAGIAYFPSASPPSQLTGLAWVLEDGTRKFYREVASMMKGLEAANLFRELAAAEARHKETLYAIYLNLSGMTEDANFPGSVISFPADAEYMEGGVEVGKALDWARAKTPEEIVEYALSLEINSYDLHLKMEQRMKDDRSARMFASLAEEEKGHLNRLQELFLRLMTPV
jgi:sulfur-carrier protein adenylyltransferase/sulfurtransferase